jgi:sugar lactone lactonase YvrE
MKAKVPVLKWLPVVAAAVLGCASNLPAQIAPAITTQPTSQTNLAGTTATFTVAVSGTGPFTYQWQLNGANLPNGIITTVAGGGSNWDGDAALGASLSQPVGVAFDGAGNMFIADTADARIRKVGTNGIINTVAGNGTNGYSGDEGPATNAKLFLPSAVALDTLGNLYIADSTNNRIRKVDTNGVISTVAGKNAVGFSGDGGLATNATLNGPTGVVLDAIGNLYIADHGNNRIRKVGTNGIISTLAGTNAPGFSGDGSAAINAKLYWPFGVALDGSGNLFIADTQNSRIRVVGTNGIITTVAGTATYGFSGDGGPATQASLRKPSCAAVDNFGNIYIADPYNDRIRQVATNGIITTVAGNGAGVPYSGAFSGDGGPATNASLYLPSGVALDAIGNLYIADTLNNRIRDVLLYAEYPTLTLTNVGAGNAGSYTVVISNSYGSVTSAVATLTVSCPPAILVQPASQWVLTGSNATLNVTASGTAPLDYAWYDNASNLVQSGLNSALTVQGFATNDAGSYTVVITNAYGSVTSQVATLTTAYPPSIATPPGSQAVLGGVNLTLSVAAGGTGPLSYQWQFNGTILPTNIITTVAGGNGPGHSGDGAPAISAKIFQPEGMNLDTFGNLYIADYYNARIRKVDTNGIITTVAGSPNGPAGYAGDGGQASNATL